MADLETGESIFEKNAAAPETIASVTKMISTAAALHYLGPSYKFRTTFWRRGEIRDGNLLGSLLVVGGGDPNISGRFYDDDAFAIFDKWAAGLRQAGILRVTGDLVLNASSFDEEYRHPDWPPERDSHWYQAPVSALSYNDNVVVVSVGKGALPGLARERDDRSGHRRRPVIEPGSDCREGRQDQGRGLAPERIGSRHGLGHRSEPVLPVGRPACRSTIRRSSSARLSRAD